MSYAEPTSETMRALFEFPESLTPLSLLNVRRLPAGPWDGRSYHQAGLVRALREDSGQAPRVGPPSSSLASVPSNLAGRDINMHSASQRALIVWFVSKSETFVLGTFAEGKVAPFGTRQATRSAAGTKPGITKNRLDTRV